MGLLTHLKAKSPRVAKLLSKESAPGWLLLAASSIKSAWMWLSHYSTYETARKVLRDLLQLLNEPEATLVLMGLGFLWLTVVALWPATTDKPNVTRRVPPADVERTDITDPARRVFIDPSITTIQIAHPPAHLTSAQRDAYRKHHIGKWMRFTGAVKDVSAYGKLELDNINVNDDEPTVHLEFDRSWHGKMSALPKGLPVTVIGKIYIVDSTFVVLRHCEIV